MKQEKVFFPSGTLILEGYLSMPPGAAKAPGVVLCHPHPLYGGSMRNNVIGAVSRALVEDGIELPFALIFAEWEQARALMITGKGR